MAEDQLGNPEEWVDRYGDYLFGYAIQRLRDREVTEDLVQETFLAALAGRDSFHGRSTARTWLLGILKHKIFDHIRRQSREKPMSDLESEDPITETMFSKRGYWKKKTIESRPSAWTSNPRSVLQDRQFRQVLDECLDNLPGRLAEAFALREIEEMSGEKVCQVLDVTQTNLWAMLHRARMRLRQCLEINWFGVGRRWLGFGKRKARRG